MTPNDAYYFAMSKVLELKEQGIEVIIKPSKSRNDERMIKKYDKPDLIPSPNLWCHVSLKFKDDSHSQKIYEMANYLGMCGISFDTGGCSGLRDWEFDWSFRYKKGDENWEWRGAREELETLINELTNDTRTS